METNGKKSGAFEFGCSNFVVRWPREAPNDLLIMSRHELTCYLRNFSAEFIPAANTDSGHVPLQRRSHIFEKITDRWNVTTSSKLSPVDANGDESQPLSRRASSTNPDLTDDARNANPSHHLFWSQKSKGTPGESSKGCRIAEIAEEKLKENPRKRTIYPLAAAKTASNIGQIIKLGDKPKIRAVPS